LLVLSGYLKAEPGEREFGEDEPPHRLAIPNREVAEVYRTTFRSWMDAGLKVRGGTIKGLLDALLDGDADLLEKQLQALATYMVSYHDVGAHEPERFYQGLMIGLLAGLEPEYEVRSNRESGDGRPDVLVKPRHRGRPGVVLELKSARPKERTLEAALKEGLRQLRGTNYAAELSAAGVEPVHRLVVDFDGKRVRVRSADAPRRAPRRRARTAARAGKPAKKVKR
jgi:hypothetical protein